MDDAPDRIWVDHTGLLVAKAMGDAGCVVSVSTRQRDSLVYHRQSPGDVLREAAKRLRDNIEGLRGVGVMGRSMIVQTRRDADQLDDWASEADAQAGKTS